jgi:pimeloyl-ACP methyl ester carboxylesterase
MAEWAEGELAIGGIAIHYYRMGRAGGPPVVLLHGFSDGGLGWLRLARDLAPAYDVVMLDAAGHGRSGGVERGFRSRAVDDVLAALDRLGLDRPALVGHSWGRPPPPGSPPRRRSACVGWHWRTRPGGTAPRRRSARRRTPSAAVRHCAARPGRRGCAR